MKLSDLISCVRGDIRVTKPVTAGRGEPLSSAARRMRDNHVGTLIVEGQKPIGLVTGRDLALGANGVSPETAVESVMTPPSSGLSRRRGYPRSHPVHEGRGWNEDLC